MKIYIETLNGFKIIGFLANKIIKKLDHYYIELKNENLFIKIIKIENDGFTKIYDLNNTIIGSGKLFKLNYIS
jgi:hypothetical protein